MLAADRSYLLDDPNAAVTLMLTAANDGWYPMCTGIARLDARYWGRPDERAAAQAAIGRSLGATDAGALGLVTFTPDELDWDDEPAVMHLLCQRECKVNHCLNGHFRPCVTACDQTTAGLRLCERQHLLRIRQRTPGSGAGSRAADRSVPP